jgi:hypothetical protein
MQRRWIVAGALATAVVAGIALWYDRRVALGIALGGLSGTLAFWLLARQTAGLLGMSSAGVAAHIYRGMFLRLGLYAATLGLAYSLDRHDLKVFAGAAGGIILVRFAVVLASAADARRAIRRLSSRD